MDVAKTTKENKKIISDENQTYLGAGTSRVVVVVLKITTWHKGKRRVSRLG